MLNKDYENKESAVRNMVVLSEQVHLDDDGHVLNQSRAPCSLRFAP